MTTRVSAATTHNNPLESRVPLPTAAHLRQVPHTEALEYNQIAENLKRSVEHYAKYKNAL